MPKIKQIILLLFCLFIKFSFSQNITLTETLKYLNEKFRDKYTFDMKNGQLILDCFTDGKKIREDRVYVVELDPFSVTFSDEEKAVIVKCLDDKGDCIDRRLFIRKDKNYYKRIAFLMDGADEKSIKGVQNAIIHMIRLTQDLKYQSSEPFEK
jgi:hypothetical protein